jgi:endonuclease III
MRRAEKAAKIQAILDQLHADVPIPLAHRDPYTLLVAVVLSAQCTDVRVNQITPKLFARARGPRQMMALSEREIADIIRPCGLAPAKSKAIRALSRAIVEEHGGRVPSSFEELEKLPGVGHKTASVVMSQAFGHAAFPVDTHIHRLAARWGLSNGSTVTRTERDLKHIFPRQSWNKLHLQIIYFGRQHCPARGHDLRRCPICSWAASKARIEAEQGRGKKLPQRRGGAEKNQTAVAGI